MNRSVLVVAVSAVCLCTFLAAQENGAPLPKPAPPAAPQFRPDDRIVTKKESENLNVALSEARKATAEKSSDAQLAAAEQAIALEPARAANYYFKAQALVGKATVDSKTGKMILPSGCAEAYQKYLQPEPKGPFSADARGVLAAAGLK